uniref:Peptidyl-prolyl cis-trans isomerase n=1 Tax=Ananas comosus var. bracteatus TaxID=296719 RepID=A0A6V7P6M2_ANACO|nr:unnamed protein product [Ananas comosus var. bracteatus]
MREETKSKPKITQPISSCSPILNPFDLHSFTKLESYIRTLDQPIEGDGKDSTAKEPSGKGKGKQAATGGEENASKGKGKGGKAADGLGTCTYVKARHILCEKQGKINEAYKKLQDGWLNNGDKVPPAEFAKIAAEYSECPSGKKGGDLGWFPRGKMAGLFRMLLLAQLWELPVLRSSLRMATILS